MPSTGVRLECKFVSTFLQASPVAVHGRVDRKVNHYERGVYLTTAGCGGVEEGRRRRGLADYYEGRLSLKLTDSGEQ